MRNHALGELDKTHLFLTVLKVRKSKIKGLANSMAGTAFFLVSKWPPSWCKERGLWSLPLLNDTNLIMESPVSWLHFILITSKHHHIWD
jgi:hypothetical protein